MPRRKIVYHNTSGGMFGMVKSVLSALVQCENAQHTPTIVVDGSPYRPLGFTGNVWNLFFEPVGDESLPHDEEVRVNYHPLIRRGYVDFQFRSRLHGLLKKYITPLPRVLQRVAQHEERFGHPPRRVGVHFRGTDHHTVQPYLPPTAFLHPLQFLRAGHTTPWLLCTDTESAVTEFSMSSEQQGMFTTDVERLPTAPCPRGVHFASTDKIKVGSDALLDAWLLSTCHAIVCRESNLADVVTYLNPSLLRVSI